jgi:pyridoxine 5-phosphate synthase
VKLHVNVDHVATLRQARGTKYPDPVWAAAACELAGADGITIHLREDRRHIQDRDLELLRQAVRGALNLEMAATDEMVSIARKTKPDVVTLEPEKRDERTTEGGLDVAGARAPIARAIEVLGSSGIPVSLFIDTSDPAVRAAKELGAPRIELHTGDYCERWHPVESGAHEAEVDRLRKMAELAHSLGLHVAAGHGLDYVNVDRVAAIQAIEELNIGHAIVARAVIVGMERAVREMLDVIRRARAKV